MNNRFWPTLCCAAVIFAGCQSNKDDKEVVSQQFIHKYGFDVSEQEWAERAQDGQVVTKLKNGVTVSHTYENGQLQGDTTYTFPDSPIVERHEVYDQDVLVREIVNDENGIPIYETVFDFDDSATITEWDEKGSPLSIEEYSADDLMEGKYFTSNHELESEVVNGFGTRIKRDRQGQLLCRDKVEEGMVTERINYHPNGGVQSVSQYKDYLMHGEQIKNAPSGRPLMTQYWNHGVLDGLKTVYRNGSKIAEIPYVNGEKHGIERHYDDLGTLTAEIEWRNDQKHGCSHFYGEETTENEWFFNGHSVSNQRFEVLSNREKLVAEMSKE